MRWWGPAATGLPGSARAGRHWPGPAAAAPTAPHRRAHRPAWCWRALRQGCCRWLQRAWRALFLQFCLSRLRSLPGQGSVRPWRWWRSSLAGAVGPAPAGGLPRWPKCHSLRHAPTAPAAGRCPACRCAPVRRAGPAMPWAPAPAAWRPNCSGPGPGPRRPLSGCAARGRSGSGLKAHAPPPAAGQPTRSGQSGTAGQC